MTNVASFAQPSKVSYLKMLVCQNMNMPQLSNDDYYPVNQYVRVIHERTIG